MQEIPITHSLFDAYLAHRNYGHMSNPVFVSQDDIATRFESTIEHVCKQNGELFLSVLTIVTEYSPKLNGGDIARMAMRCGYVATCGYGHERIYYPPSPGGAQNTLALLVFQTIRVTL